MRNEGNDGLPMIPAGQVDFISQGGQPANNAVGGRRMNDRRYKLLYDGQCPFCRREVEWLKRRDSQGRLAAEDITDPAFRAEDYGLSQEEVMRVMHGILPDGRILRRVEAIQEAYRTVGLCWLVAPLSWPILDRIADIAYGLFARNRVALGRLFGRECGGSCSRSTRRQSS